MHWNAGSEIGAEGAYEWQQSLPSRRWSLEHKYNSASDEHV
jgi:hypothetical protein